jgi:hypothetical protein
MFWVFVSRHHGAVVLLSFGTNGYRVANNHAVTNACIKCFLVGIFSADRRGRENGAPPVLPRDGP